MLRLGPPPAHQPVAKRSPQLVSSLLSHRRIQLCKRQPGSGTEQQCTAVLLASPLLPPGLAVPYTLGTAGVAAEVHAAAAGHAQPMQL